MANYHLKLLLLSPKAGFLCATMHEPAEAIRNDGPGLQPGLCWRFMSPGATCSPDMCFQLRSRVSTTTLAALFFLRLVLGDAECCRPGTFTCNSVVLCICYSISGNKEFVFASLCCSVEPSYFYPLESVDSFTLEQRN